MVFFKQSDTPTAKSLTLPPPPSPEAILADLSDANDGDPIFALFRKESTVVPQSIAGLLLAFDGAMRSDGQRLLSDLAAVATELNAKLQQVDQK
uniref:Uncharacterized protein n=1 Tax=Plectus sambesii TaxID=2011161 RepID=A0A914UQI7_9BILA